MTMQNNHINKDNNNKQPEINPIIATIGIIIIAIGLFLLVLNDTTTDPFVAMSILFITLGGIIIVANSVKL